MIIDKEKWNMARARNCIGTREMKDAGITQGMLNAVYNGKSVKPETAGKIARSVGVDVAEILVDETGMKS